MNFLRVIKTTLHKSVTKKLLVTVFSIYLIFTIFVTAIHIYIEYDSEYDTVNRDITAFFEVIEKSLAKAIWNLDTDQIQAQLDGALNSETIIGIKINTVDGELLSAGTTEMKDDLIIYKFEIRYEAEDINRIVVLGEASLFTSEFIILKRVKTGVIAILANAAIKTLAVWLLFLWGGYKYISIPLSSVSRTARNVSEGKQDLATTRIHLDKNRHDDEIGDFADAFNTLTEKLTDYQKKLLQATNRVVDIIDCMPSIIIGINKDKKVTDWNLYASKVSGLSLEDAIGQDIEQVYPYDTSYLYLIDEAFKSNKEQNKTKIPVEVNGEQRTFNLTVYPLTQEEHKAAVVRVDDITSQVHLEGALTEGEKLASVGILSAGVAHEINNPLTGIIDACRTIKRRTSVEFKGNIDACNRLGINFDDIVKYNQDRKIPDFIELINVSSNRISTIVSNLLGYTRETSKSKESIDITELLKNALGLLETDLKFKSKKDIDKINITENYPDDLPKVVCCASEIQQVILNILINAAQALVGLEKQPHISISVFVEEEFLKIAIVDNGPGMEPETRKHIFEPFYTTKPAGGGTGLGLSVAYNIVTEKHNGKIEVESISSVGTKFVVSLPL